MIFSKREIEQHQLDQGIRDTVNWFISESLRTYLALVIRLGEYQRERALTVTTDLLDIKFDPARCASYAGCYLYNFISDSPEAMPISLAENIEIRLSTFGDVARGAPVAGTTYSSFEGDYLPPAYMLAIKLSEVPLYVSVLSAYGYGNTSYTAQLEDAITALRLHQPNYVGRGAITQWKSGLTFGAHVQ